VTTATGPGSRARGERRVTVLQVLKTALAATLAWEAARLVTGEPSPVFAPLTALLVVQITVRRSLREAAERLVGVVAGVVVALLLARLVGLSALSIGLLVAGGLVVGRLVRLGAAGAVQVPVSALLVLIVGTQGDVVVARVEDTAIGAAVGVLVNLAVAPQIRLGPAVAAVAGLTAELAGLLLTLSAGAATRFDEATSRVWLTTSRRLPASLDRAQAALDAAADSLRFNPRRRRAADRVERLGEAVVALDHVVTQARGTTRTLFDLARVHGQVDLPGHYAAALGAVGRALLAHQAAVRDETGTEDLERAIEEARAAVAAAVAHGPQTGARRDDAWLARGSVLSDLGRLLRELDPRGPHSAAFRQDPQA
jgi:hypothetical protein